jgi:hypothetical protein
VAEKKKADSAENVKARRVTPGPMDEVLDQSTLDALMNADPENTITTRRFKEIRKGTANPAGCWMHAPAHVELNAMGDNRMTLSAAMGPDGVQVRRVERVHLDLIPGTKVVAIRYASPNDETATPVKRYQGGSSAWINLIELLGDQGLTVETGYKEYYRVGFIPEGSPFFPGIAINLGLRQTRRKEPKSAQSSAAPADPATEETAAAETEPEAEE